MPTAVCVFPSGLPAELHSPAEILISLWTLVEAMFQTSPYLRSNSSFWARWSQKLLLLLYSRLAGWQSMCFIWHLKNSIHFLMIIVLAGRRKKIWSQGAKHISWQCENSAALFLTLSISSHGKYYRTLALLEISMSVGEEETWMMCHLHVWWAACAKSLPCFYATGNRNQVFTSWGNVCRSENEQKGTKSSLFSLVVSSGR